MTSQEDYAAVMPSRCPVTGEPFFMVLPDGQCPEIQVPTYGGPIQSGTIPEWDAENQCWYRSVYDHDEGFWLEETEEVQGAAPLWANVSDQIPRTQDVKNATDSPERLSASVLFGPFVVVRTLCEELLTEAGCPPWKVDALQAAVNAVNQIMMMSPGEIHLNSGNIREAISNQGGKCLCQAAFDSIPLSR